MKCAFLLALLVAVSGCSKPVASATPSAQPAPEKPQPKELPPSLLKTAETALVETKAMLRKMVDLRESASIRFRRNAEDLEAKNSLADQAVGRDSKRDERMKLVRNYGEDMLAIADKTIREYEGLIADIERGLDRRDADLILKAATRGETIQKTMDGEMAALKQSHKEAMAAIP